MSRHEIGFLSAIAWHRAGVSATSAVAGLPGGWWIAGTLPADLIQYFGHVVVVLQKLAYLHGWPKKKFAELVGRAVPVLGGGVAGIITWIAFGNGAKRLLEHLEGLPLAEA